LRLRAFDFVETEETHVVRDQLAENINAAMELQKGGKTVHAVAEHAAEKSTTGPRFTGDMEVFANAVETGHPETEAVAKP
jgi:hypothetical protein